MDQPGDVVRLLEEIRDLQREHFAEYRRINEEYREMNRLATESTKQGYQRSMESFRSFLRAVYILIGLCLGANLWILVRLAGQR
jgi:hypothetical protein